MIDVVVHQHSREAFSRCVAALDHQTYANFGVIVTAAREAGLSQGSAPYVVFLEEEDVPDPELLKTLVRARRTTGADVVTCGLRLANDEGEHRLRFFAGEPGGLGAVANAYGTVALVRRAVIDDLAIPWPAEGDADWPLLARLGGSGASIVSVPMALVERRAAPGSVESDPAAALLAIEQLEQALPDPLRGSARLAAGLAANVRQPAAATRVGAVRRAAEIVRRVTRHSSRRLRRDSHR